MIYKIGHRGAMGYEPENTLLSFRRAIELGVDMVELDVHLCRSGELVVIHDDRLERTTNGCGLVAEKTLAELKSLDAGKGEIIPALTEVIDFIANRVKINIELKGRGTEESVAKLIQRYIVEYGWNYDDFYVSSFDHYQLQGLSKLDSRIKTGALLVGKPVGLAKFAAAIGAFSLNLHYHYADREFIADARQRGLKVFVWTVNEPEDIKRMVNLNVDAICSNYPDILSNYIDKYI